MLIVLYNYISNYYSVVARATQHVQILRLDNLFSVIKLESKITNRLTVYLCWCPQKLLSQVEIFLLKKYSAL